MAVAALVAVWLWPSAISGPAPIGTDPGTRTATIDDLPDPIRVEPIIARLADAHRQAVDHEVDSIVALTTSAAQSLWSYFPRQDDVLEDVQPLVEETRGSSS